MTDNTTASAMYAKGGVQITCILYQGAYTVGDAVYTQTGHVTEDLVTCGAPIWQGMWVGLDAATSNTFSATGGAPVVERVANGADVLMGLVISRPKWVKTPTSSMDAASENQTWADMLSGDYYMEATVWFPTVTGIANAIVTVDGSNAIAPGATTLAVDVTAEVAKTHNGVRPEIYLQYDTGSGNLVAANYTPAGTDGDTYSMLVFFVGGAIAAAT